MSFVDLMKNDAWSDADIVNRTEAMISSEFPPSAVAILNRKATGALLGQYTMTVEEQMELGRYAQVCEAARLAGNEARANMMLLKEVQALEAARARLEIPAGLEPEGDELEAWALERLQADAAERSEAEAVVAQSSEAIQALFVLRNPPAEPETEEEQA